jgi:ABC-2 type transport system ATP-binding protein
LHAALLGITADRTVRQAADRLGVLDYWHRPLREYSRGMLRKTGLAAATLCRPAILVLDEPTAGLDSGGSQRLRELVLAHRRNGGTAVISSHHLDEMTKICDHVVLLNEGRVRRRLDLRDLRSAPRYVVELGAPADPGTVDTLTIPGGALESIDGRTLHIRLESVKIAEDVLRHLVRAGLSVRTARLEEPDLKRFLAEEVPVE